MKDLPDWHELIERHLRGELSESEKEHLAKALDSDAAARREFVEQVQWDTRLADVLRGSSPGRELLQAPSAEAGTEPPAPGRIVAMPGRTPTTPFTKALLAIAASVALLLGVSQWFQRPQVDREIATISGLNGALQWTGDGGLVVRDLAVGTRLPGGTIEGLAPFSWFELRFEDGSKVSISGNSALTYSDLGRKVLHLKKGSVSANVNPQPPGKPMSIQTPTAMIEVVGTRFEVESGLAATMVDVREGSVRVKRLSDGATVDASARHQVVVAADQELRPTPVPEAVNHWTSRLQLGPERALGRWQPGQNGGKPTLVAVPYTTEHGLTIFATGFGVSRCDGPAVVLQPGARLKFHGRMASAHPLWFGLTVRHLNGDFAGRFQTILKAEDFSAGKDFEVTLSPRDFHLDPSLKEMREKLPRDPLNLVVESVWCHSLDKPAGLEVTEVELLAPIVKK